jgi:hypothetical protein
MPDVRRSLVFAERGAGRVRIAAVRAGAGRAALLWLAVTVAGACAACGVSGAGAVTRRAPAPTATPTPASVAGLRLPLDAYALSGAQEAVAEYTGLFLEKTCMAKLGFSFLPGLNTGYVARGARTFAEYNSRLWGITNPAQAGQYGYHLPPWAQQSGARPQSVTSLPAPEQVALIGFQVTKHSGPAGRRPAGVPAGGCHGQAQREAAAVDSTSAGQAASVVAQLRLESFNRTQADPRVRKVFAAWSSCMRTSGYDYQTPFKPTFNMAARPTVTEIRIAKADVACKYRTNLLGVAYAVQTDEQNALIAAHAPQLAAIRTVVRSQQQALAKADTEYDIAGS